MSAAENAAREWDEWVRLFANRNEMADAYADLLLSRGTEWDGWSGLNHAIIRRWSLSALKYIKTCAWKVAS